MCYKYPGPRCSSHAAKELEKARDEYDVALKTNDPDACIEAKAKLAEAENNYYMTPQGQESLRQEIATMGDPDGELAYKLEFGVMAREEAIKEAKVLDKGDVKNASEVEAEQARLDREHAAKLKAEKDELETANAVRKAQGRMAVSKFQNLKLDDPASGYATYESSLIPEAANLDQVSSVVDSVHGGANTSNAIAESVGIKTSRGGNYYANAANYIGLIQKSESDEGHEYELTENGRAYHSGTPAERAAMMRELVNATPIMQAYIDSGRDREALEDYIRKSGDGHEASVAKRRASSLVSWDDKLNSKDFESVLGSTSEETKLRAVSAAARLKEERAAKERLTKITAVRSYGTCMKCFTSLPASGKCDCDD